ncbi:restriction endonuclease subunit S [Halopseudomonas litoralis]
MPNNNLHPEFVAYYLRSPEFRTEMLAFSTMSTRASLNNEMIGHLKISFPSLTDQKYIAWVLKTLDNKIELNHQINTTLESMAQALFKSWFVDFDPAIDNALAAGNPIPDELAARAERRAKAAQQPSPEHPHTLPAEVRQQFPDRFVFTEAMGWVPEGWEAKSLVKIAEYQNGLALQKFRPENEDDYLPVVKIAQLKKGFADGNEKASPNIRPECIVDDGDILFSWSGSLVVDIWCGGKGALNQHLFKVTSKNYPKWFYFQCTSLHLEEFQRIAAGKAVTMGHIKREHLNQAYSAVPPKELLRTLDMTFVPLLDRVIATRIEAKNLASLRDTLLPKLLSGQLRIPDAQAAVDEALVAI